MERLQKQEAAKLAKYAQATCLKHIRVVPIGTEGAEETFPKNKV